MREPKEDTVKQNACERRPSASEWQTFLVREQLLERPPLARASLARGARWAFWALRIYIVGLLILVGIGLYRGLS